MHFETLRRFEFKPIQSNKSFRVLRTSEKDLDLKEHGSAYQLLLRALDLTDVEVNFDSSPVMKSPLSFLAKTQDQTITINTYAWRSLDSHQRFDVFAHELFHRFEQKNHPEALKLANQLGSEIAADGFALYLKRVRLR